MTETPIVNVTHERDSVTIAGAGALDLSNSADFARALKDASETAEHVVQILGFTSLMDVEVCPA
ncbi:MAG: hypothetical protein Q7T82_14955 [Armatimonadota bacterium]|nr:hypothetical protein [Armatimonadota bacterium]